jgi:hypothetical protein
MPNRIHPADTSQREKPKPILTELKDLPDDLIRLIGEKLQTIQESPQVSPANKTKLAKIISQISAIFSTKTTRKVQLSALNKELRKNFGYTSRLKELDSTYQSTPLNQVANSVDTILRDIPMRVFKQSDKTAKNLKTTLRSINNKLRADTDPLLENSDLSIQQFNTLAEAKQDYMKRNPGKNFDEEIKKWSTLWDSNYKSHTNFKLLKSSIQKYQKKMIDYDEDNKKKNRDILESFLKLEEDKITYKKFSNAVQSLPIGAKVITKLAYA